MKPVHYALVVALSLSAGLIYDTVRKSEPPPAPDSGEAVRAGKIESNRVGRLPVRSNSAGGAQYHASYAREPLPEPPPSSGGGAPSHEPPNPAEDPDYMQQQQDEMGSQLKSLKELEASMRENGLPPEHIRQIVAAQTAIAEQGRRLGEPRPPAQESVPPPTRETFVAELKQAGIPQRDIEGMAGVMFQPVPESAKTQATDVPARPPHEGHEGE